MRILVTVATRHGATAGLGEELGTRLYEGLHEHGIEAYVDVIEPGHVESVDRYDAVVLGSAVYMGRWLEPARRFAKKHADALAARPTWLFSSGPIGEPPRPADEPADASNLVRAINARGHRVFPGRIDRGALGLGERAVVRSLHVPDGDFRDFDAVQAWALDIAAAIAVEPVA
ncbi:MAG: hypothetical protein GEV10_14450 [Streptosporangiales bacterium]|nr:hypothetical protein [Streptosporangiales bacterium]